MRQTTLRLCRLEDRMNPAPMVTGFTFGDGTDQRSIVRQMVVTFSEPVDFMPSVASAFTVFRLLASTSPGPNTTVDLVASPATGPASSVTISFTGALSQYGSLINGIYDFTIDAAQVSSANGSLDGNGDLVPGGNYFQIGSVTNRYFRYYCDVNGDGVLTQNPDFISFRNAFARPSSVFDFDDDGTVGQSDFNPV